METILASAFGCEVQLQQQQQGEVLVDELVTSAKVMIGITPKKGSSFQVHHLVFLLCKLIDPGYK